MFNARKICRPNVDIQDGRPPELRPYELKNDTPTIPAPEHAHAYLGLFFRPTYAIALLS